MNPTINCAAKKVIKLGSSAFCLLLIYSSTVLAAPSITSAPVTVMNGSNVKIAGSAFGAKATAAPLRFDTFSTATSGQTMSQATNWWSDGNYPLYVTNLNPRYSGNKSASAEANGPSSGNAAPDPISRTTIAFRNNVGFAKTKKVYLNYWYYFDANEKGCPVGFADAAGTPYWQIKSLRILTESPPDGNFTADDYPSIYYSTQNFQCGSVNNSQPNNLWDRRPYLGGGTALYFNPAPIWATGWYNMAIQIKMDSTIGAGDGAITAYISAANFGASYKVAAISPVTLIDAINKNGKAYYDGINIHNYVGNVPPPPAFDATKTDGYPAGYTVNYGSTWYKAIQGSAKPVVPTDTAYWTKAPYGYEINTHLQYGDIYIDNSWARVEIGDASTYSACTHREIQVPITWGTDGIEFKVNQGSFPDLATAYIYVVDENGYVSNGKAIQFEKSGAVTPPKNLIQIKP